MEKEQLRERLASAAGMPKDVTMKAAVITVLGNFEACIENYRGITEYTECLIRIQTKGGQIRFTGRHLQVEYNTNEEMKITGRIETIEFTHKEGRE